MTLVLNDIEKAALQGFDWLGFDIKLVDGDFAFGGDGDLLVHDHPVESFAACLQYAMQVAGNLVFDPSNPSRAVRAALAAVNADPRIQEAQLLKSEFGVSPNGTTDVTTLVISLTLVLTSGDTFKNMVFPLTFDVEGGS